MEVASKGNLKVMIDAFLLNFLRQAGVIWMIMRLMI